MIGLYREVVPSKVNLFGNAKILWKVGTASITYFCMYKEEVEAALCGKKAILERLKKDGHASSEFTFYYLGEMSQDGKLKVCSIEELPDNLDSFCCQAQSGWPLYNYDQSKDPNIVKIEKPESDEKELD